MSAVQWGYSYGYQDPAALEQRVEDLETNQAILEASIQAAYYVYGRGAGAGVAVNAGQTVRIPLPNIVAKLPNDTSWVREVSGIYTYTGNVDGEYSAKCTIAFGVSLGVLALYTWTLAEGTGLDTGSPVIRDSAVFQLERAVNTGQGTALCSGPLTLRDTGGQLALFAAHSSGLTVTITPGIIIPFLHRIDPEPA